MLPALEIPPYFREILDTVNRVCRAVLFLPPQASSYAASVDTLQYVELALYAAIAVLYVGTGTFFLVKYRSRPDRRVGQAVNASAITGAVAVTVFTMFAAFWLAGFLQYRRMRTVPAGALDVYVAAKQWVWHFDYADGGASVGVLYVPAGRPIRLLLTSRDVIHSFFVPAFRLKQDAVPGTYTIAWFEAVQPGVYDVLCSQMCGPGHPRMTGQVAALSPADYRAWRQGAGASQATAGSTSLAERGRLAAANFGCLRCHTLDGQRYLGPTWLGLFESRQPLLDGSEVVADEAYLTESMMDPLAKIVRGFSPIMPSYQGLLSPADTAAIVDFIKSLRDPAQPHIVTPPPAVPPPASPSGPAPGTAAAGAAAPTGGRQ